MGRIQQLDPLLINQIAAGEVIERPASVLKETLENALDAGSNKITVSLTAGGKALIEITDNGDGIYRDDLGLAISPHATSKIASMTDLQHVASLGFRGEALASIASISKFSLISKPKDQAQAYRLEVEGKDSVIQEFPDAHPKGTTIRVKDIFFNVPVRQKFLKQDKTEYLYCEEVFKRIAMAHPHVAFELKDEGESKLYYPAQFGDDAYRHRAAKVFGKKFIDNAQTLDVMEHDIHLYGLVASPDYSRSQSDQQHIYLNGRPIKDKLINHAIRQAYEDRVAPGRFPAFVIYIEMDPTQVDVNVHPQKTEVRFQSPRVIHDLIIARVRNLWHPETIQAQPQHFAQRDYSISPQMSLKHLASQSGALSQPNAMQSQSFDEHAVLVHEGHMYVIDYGRLYKAHYQKFLLLQQHFESESLLFPARVTAAARDLDRLESHRDTLGYFGIEVDRVSETDLLLRAVPKLPFKLDEKALLDAVVAPSHVQHLNIDRVRSLLLDAIKITPEMQKDLKIIELLRESPELPHIKIDLQNFEVIA